METTLLKKMMQQATKAVCFLMLVLAMANCNNNKEAEEAKEAADKAKEEAQKAKEETDKVKKDLEARIATLESAGPLADAVKIQKDIADLKNVVGDKTGGLVKEIDDLEITIGDDTTNGCLAKDIADLKAAVGDDQKGLIRNLTSLQTIIGDGTQGLIKAIGEKANKAEVYTKKETLTKINKLNQKIYDAVKVIGGVNKNFTADPIKEK
jgi:hypothetical protein